MLKDESIHLSLSIVSGIVVGALFGNYWAVLLAVIAGVFVDLDHFIDYFLYKRSFEFDKKLFSSGKYFDYSKKVYLFLHGYEYGILLAIIGICYPDLRWLFLSVGISLILHLIYDTISNRPKWPTYFIVYRLVHNFNHADFDFNPIFIERSK